jgi:hypothetical protein
MFAFCSFPSRFLLPISIVDNIDGSRVSIIPPGRPDAFVD